MNIIISSKTDIAAYVSNASPGNCVEAGEVAEYAVARAIHRADHPAYGDDWSAWLAANAERIALEAMS